MKCLPIALLFLGIASSGAMAQAGGAAPGPTTAQPAAEDDREIVVEGEAPKEKRRVCEMRTSTGSIVPKRVCRTVAQIEQDQREASDAIDRVNRDRETRDQIQALREQGG